MVNMVLLLVGKWLLWFLECLDRALIATDELLAVVLNKARFWDTNANMQISTRQRLLLNKMLDGFEGKLTTSKWSKIAKCSQDTALRDIQDLVDKQILVKEDSGSKRGNIELLPRRFAFD